MCCAMISMTIDMELAMPRGAAMSASPIRPIESPSAWLGAEVSARRDWIHELSAAEIADLDRAVAHARATGKPIGELVAR